MTNNYHFSEKHAKEYRDYVELLNNDNQKDALYEATQIALQAHPNDNDMVRFALVQNLMYQRYLQVKRSKYS